MLLDGVTDVDAGRRQGAAPDEQAELVRLRREMAQREVLSR